MNRTGSFAGVIVFASALLACRPSGSAGEMLDAAASPQAKAEPAPLALLPPADANATSTSAPVDAGPPPLPMRADKEVGVDQPTEKTPRDTTPRDGGASPTFAASAKDFSGYTLQAVLRVSDVPAPPKAPEVNDRALDAARKKTEPHLTIDASQTRARIVVASSGFVLPMGTEIRARADRYGHVLLWPRESTYRVVAPGALRALVGERRLDVAPLSAAEIAPSGDGARRLNVKTRKVEVTTRAAKATFEIATLSGAGDGGALVCRALLDLMNAPPSTPLCATDEVPLHAELRWTTKGVISFDVSSFARRFDLPSSQMAAPPATLAFVPSPPPPLNTEVMLSKQELAALRNGPVDVPPPPASNDAQAPPPDSGLVLVNATDELRFAWIDGVPIAWLAPGARESIAALQRGRYVLQWRTFLGDSFEPPQSIVVPSINEIGERDAGPRP